MLGLVLVNIAFFMALLFVVYHLKRRGMTFSKQVIVGLLMGIGFGSILNWVYGEQATVISDSLEWVGMVGNGYVQFLKMLIMPLIFVSIVMAFIKSSSISKLGKVSFSVISILILTTAIAAVIGIGSSLLFNLDASNISIGEAETSRSDSLEEGLGNISEKSVPDRLLNIIPSNPFLDLTGERSTSTIAIVLFSSLIGIALIKFRDSEPDKAKILIELMDSLQELVLKLVKIIISFTPYGVMSLMAKMVALSSWSTIWDLSRFLLASYVALAAMFIVHLIILWCSGTSPRTYLRNALPVLAFSFSSRSSAATLPMNVRTQMEQFKVKEGIANFSGSFGLSIGQNGCAGIYPAMLAVMIAPSVGIDPLNPIFLINVVMVVAISSFGVVGVGGGATLAAIIVLSTLNLPVGLAGLLISIEPLIDMGRTAVNVSGSMTAGITTNKITKEA